MIATVEMPADELEQMQADLASTRAEIRRLRAGAPPDQESEKLRAERDHLAAQNGLLRDAANKLHRAESENERLRRTVTALAAERDTARAELKEAGNRIAGIRETNRRLSAKWQGYAEQARQRQIKADNLQRQLDDTIAALIAASEDRAMASTLSRALGKAMTEIGRARTAAVQLLSMEREHTGSGREGHLSENDLRPLLHALDIATEEQP